MLKIDLATVNWLAVLAAALAAFFLGAIWYTAMFGKLWVRLQGLTEERQREIQALRPPALFFGGMIVAYFMLAVAVALLVTSFGLTSWTQGVLLGLVLWIGPGAALALTGHLASDRPFGVYLIDAGFQLVALPMMGVILALWR